MAIRGEGGAFVPGVSPQEVFDFVLDPAEGGTRFRHVEAMHFGHGVLSRLYDLVAGRWFERAVTQEVQEIARLLVAGGERAKRASQ
ncbi:MAG: hypothetical protein H0U26_00360 [Acidimicrobiia bacterium]|nr:hypothetical protein [Acidimicrobiia bacterium]